MHCPENRIDINPSLYCCFFPLSILLSLSSVCGRLSEEQKSSPRNKKINYCCNIIIIVFYQQ